MACNNWTRLVLLLSGLLTQTGLIRCHLVKPEGPVFQTAFAEMDRSELYYHQGTVTNWHETIGAVVQGGGSLIKRTPEGAAKIKAAWEGKNHQQVYDRIMSENNWQNMEGAVSGNLLEVTEDPKYVSIQPNHFPYNLPAGVEHWMIWMRVSPVTREAFAPRGGEAVPDPSFQDPSRVEALIRYIDHYDFYGWYGIDDAHVMKFALSSFAHATNPVWKDPESAHTVTREQGAAAMKWLGRHVAAAIQHKFPEEDFQVLFNRSPPRWKSVPNPDHFHIFVLRK